MCLSGTCTSVGERCNSSFPICDSQNHQCLSNNTNTNSSTTGPVENPSGSPDPTASQKSGSNFVIIGASAGGGIALIGGVCLAGICVAKSKRKKQDDKPKEATNEEKGVPDTGFYADVSGGVSNQDFLWNSQISNVIKLNHLGSGNFGEVYKGVWQKEPSKSVEVALKTLKEEEHFSDFVEEAAMLSQLDHTNIVKFLGVFVPNNEKYIVTEFMNRGSLLDLLQSTKFNQKDCKEMYAKFK